MRKPHIDYPSSVFSFSQGKEHKNMHLLTSVRKEVVERISLNAVLSNVISQLSVYTDV